MTTHLVIADQDTLDMLIFDADPELSMIVCDEEYIQPGTGDRWLFRTPEDAVPPMEDVGFIFGLDMGVGNSLPLAAACDLLGVDEL